MIKEYQNKEWLQEQYLKYGHMRDIAKLCNVSDDTINYWLKKHSIVKNPNRRMSSRNHTLNENYFETIDNEHKSYWLGFIMADGCITKTDKKYPPNRFHFCLKNESCEKEHLKKFLEDVNGNYKIVEKTIVNNKLNFESEICELRINSKLFVANLIKNDIVMSKTGKEVIPNTVPEHLIKHFIRGYFDGDGSITKRKTFRICSSSLVILEQINEIFKNNLNISFKIYCDNKYKKPFYTIDSNHFGNNKKALDFIYENSTIFLDRKYDRYLEYFNSPGTE